MSLPNSTVAPASVHEKLVPGDRAGRVVISSSWTLVRARAIHSAAPQHEHQVELIVVELARSVQVVAEVVRRQVF